MNMQDLIGREIGVSLEPYQFGKARIVSIAPAHEYGRPDKPVAGRSEIVVEAVDMKEVSRLFGHSSSKPVKPGTSFNLFLPDVAIPAMIEGGNLRYVYPV